MKLFQRIKKAVTISANIMLVIQAATLGGILIPQKTAAASGLNPQDIVINELAWAGSSTSTADEWIELRNRTSSPINLEGWDITMDSGPAEAVMVTLPAGAQIPANGYYLISNFDDATSTLNVVPDYIDASVSLNNSNLQVSLYDGTWGDPGVIRVDVAGDYSAPFAGNNTAASERYTMERNRVVESGDIASSWHTAATSVGYDALSTERGTPGSLNSQVPPTDLVSTLITVEENNPLTNDKVIGLAGASEEGLTINAYEDSTLTTLIGSGTVNANGSFEFEIGDNKADENDKIYIVGEDLAGNQTDAVVLTNDTTAPTISSAVTPTSANQNTKTVKIQAVADEELLQQNVPVSVSEPIKVYVQGPTYGVKLVVNDSETNPTTAYLVKGADGKYTFEYQIDSNKEQEIAFSIEAKDLAGNSVTKTGSFTLDNIAPGKVTSLKATATDGKIDLSWTNPTDKDFAGVKVFRDGKQISTSLLKGGVLTDTGLVNGTVYIYDVYAYDTSGNRSEKATLSETPRAAVVVAAAAITDVAPNVVANLPKQEIKAATDENKPSEESNKDTQVKDQKKFPAWGVVFLLILAGIGAYLFYSQRPELNSSSKK